MSIWRGSANGRSIRPTRMRATMADITVVNASNEAVVAATRAQRRAADPAVCAWVNASAGSGKTSVLRDRVLRLLLADARPTGIFCLTFTRAAAAEMANRISNQ